MTFSIAEFDLDAFVIATLTEDMGGVPGAGGRDLTCESVVPADAVFTGVMDSRDAVTVAGLPIAAAFFRRAATFASPRDRTHAWSSRRG